MNYETFVSRFAELAAAPREKVTAAIAAATLSVPAFWGTKRAEGIGYLAAHLLATGPGGFGVRTEAKPDPKNPYSGSIYGMQFFALMQEVTLRSARVL